MALKAGVVVVRRDPQPDIAHAVQRQNCIIKVDQVGMIFVNQVNRAVVELLAVGGIGNAASLSGVPIPDQAALTRRVVLRVQVLRVQTFPPLAFAVGFGQMAVSLPSSCRKTSWSSKGVRVDCGDIENS